MRNIGTDMPSHTRTARMAKRRSGGVVSTTYAAATPADAMTTFATIRAFCGVMYRDQLRRDPLPGVLLGWLPWMFSEG